MPRSAVVSRMRLGPRAGAGQGSARPGPGTGRRLAILALLTWIAWMPAALPAKDFYPTTSLDGVDNNPGDGECASGSTFVFCSLRAAIMEANALGGADTIHLDTAHYRLSIAGGDEDAALEGDLDITEDLTIEGDGFDKTIIDAQGIDRVFDISGGATATIDGVTIRGGKPTGEASDNRGGGIRIRPNSGLELRWSRVTANQAQYGAAILGTQMLNGEILDSEVDDNLVQQSEGLGSTVVELSGQPNQFFRVERSSIVDNRCSSSAGCATGLSLGSCRPFLSSVANSTISGNDGFGLTTALCEVAIYLNTIVDNALGGIICAQPGDSPLTSYIENTILANNGGSDCSLHPGCFETAGHHNLDSDNSCDLGVGDLPATDPMLQPLGAVEPLYPHFTRSHHPRWGSPVIDAGMTSSVSSEDQEAVGRPFGAAYDMGSIEVLPCAAAFPDLHLALTFYSGTTVVEACRSITTGTGVVLQTGSDVTFVAREWIAIGNGFSVHAGAELRAAIVRWAASGV